MPKHERPPLESTPGYKARVPATVDDLIGALALADAKGGANVHHRTELPGMDTDPEDFLLFSA